MPSSVTAGYHFDSQVEVLSVTVAQWGKHRRYACMFRGSGVGSPAWAVNVDTIMLCRASPGCDTLTSQEPQHVPVTQLLGGAHLVLIWVKSTRMIVMQKSVTFCQLRRLNTAIQKQAQSNIKTCSAIFLSKRVIIQKQNRAGYTRRWEQRVTISIFCLPLLIETLRSRQPGGPPSVPSPILLTNNNFYRQTSALYISTFDQGSFLNWCT